MERAEHFTRHTKDVTLSLLNNHRPTIDMPTYRIEELITQKQKIEKCSAVIKLPMAFHPVIFPSKANYLSAISSVKVVSGWSSIYAIVQCIVLKVSAQIIMMNFLIFNL
jgi:hypothetical protein